MNILAKYINIKLSHDGRSIESVRESATKIKISELSNKYKREMELTSYSVLSDYGYGQFALSFNNDVEPSKIFISKESEVNEQKDSIMHSIVDRDNGKKWWIESKEISKQYNKYYFFKSVSIKSLAGVFYLHFQISSIWYSIRVSITDNKTLSTEGVTNLVNTFKNDFYKLIIDKNSIGKIDFLHSELVNKSIQLEDLEKILISLDNIIKKPYKTLIHTVNKQRSGIGQPTQRTFIEYSQNSEARNYSSRAISETIKNEVNGYLLYILQQIIDFLKDFQSKILVNNKSEYYENLKSLDEQFEIINNSNNFDFKNSSVYLDNQRAIVIKKIESWVNKKVNSRESNYELYENFELKFILGEKHAKRYGFYITLIEDSKLISKFLYFNEGMASILSTLYNSTIIIKASVQIKDMDTYKGKIPGYRIIDLNSISIEKLYTFQSSFKKNYSKENLEIDNNIKESIKKNSDNVYSLITETDTYYSSLGLIIDSLILRVDSLARLGVQPKRIRPSSVIYHQNIDYSYCLDIYHKLKVQEYKDNLKIISQFMRSILPSDLPNVYERWCLLKIIYILINDFKFIPINPYWEQEVINSIVSFDNSDTNKLSKAFSLEFKHLNNANDSDGIYLSLFYEAKIYNGKRPDYRISYSKGLKPDTDLIMDAKFHDPVDLSGIVKELAQNDKTLNEKDYREIGSKKDNWVYILCPSIPVISNPTSCSVWSKYAYYGGNFQFEWDDKLPVHKYGGILLTTNPTKTSSEHNLKRLIAMYLQMQGFKDCILCGSKVTYEEQKTESQSTKYSCTCSNEKCRHFFIRTHCQNCKTQLFKHGSYWTYHTLSPMDPNNAYNLACPKCGHFLPPKE